MFDISGSLIKKGRQFYKIEKNSFLTTRPKITIFFFFIFSIWNQQGPNIKV